MKTWYSIVKDNDFIFEYRVQAETKEEAEKKLKKMTGGLILSAKEKK